MIDTKLLEYIEFKYNININKFRYEEDNIIAFYNDTVPTMWDYNFIYFKKNPNLLKLIEISNKEKVNNEKHNKNFLKVIFEINAILPQEISDYYENLGLNCEEISFMTIDKYCLSTWKKYNDLKIILVNNAELLDKHINFCYENDFKISKEYAENRKKLNLKIYTNEYFKIYSVYYKSNVIGTAEVFIYNNIAKIENIFISEKFRNIGACTELLKTIISNYNAEFYLATYTDDLAINLYTKLGFKVISKQINLLNIFE